MLNQAKQRFILIDVVLPQVPKEDAELDLAETISIINTLGSGKIAKIIQKRAHPDPATFVGKGKAEEIADMVRSEKIDVVILSASAKSTQLYRLLQMYWGINPNIKVWDRIDLILNIFAKHARTAEAKLQINLAQMRHMGPRIYGLSEELGRQGGGIGDRGVGETNVELMKRHWREQMKNTKTQLVKITKGRQAQLDRRRAGGFKTVSIVGYTNAGKTSLFNILTNKQKKAQDILFATLDSVVGKLYFQESRTEVLVTDTIGFIKQLPPSLIDAFKSTLMESINANLLLHVIDASDTRMYEKIQTVEKILTELGIKEKPIINVYNKADNLTEAEIIELKKKNGIVISVKEQAGIEVLIKTIQSSLFPSNTAHHA